MSFDWDVWELTKQSHSKFDETYDKYNGDICAVYAELDNEIKRVYSLSGEELDKYLSDTDQDERVFINARDTAGRFLINELMNASGWKNCGGVWEPEPNEELIDMIMTAVTLEGGEASLEKRETVKWMLSKAKYRNDFLKYFVRKSNELEKTRSKKDDDARTVHLEGEASTRSDR